MIESIICVICVFVITILLSCLNIVSKNTDDRIFYSIALFMCGVIGIVTLAMVAILKEQKDNGGYCIESNIVEYKIIEHVSVTDGDTTDVKYDIFYKYKK